MGYYIIQWSLNNSVMGYLPQVKEVIHNCHVSEDANFIGKYQFRKTETNVVTSYPVIDSKSNLTDIVQAGGIGFSADLVISDKLKSILVKHTKPGIQFIRTSVFWQGIENQDFWLVHPYEFNYDYIAFSESEVYLTEMSTTKIEKLSIKNVDDFEKAKQDIEQRGFPFSIKIDKYKIKENNESDFFALRYIEGGVKFLVSERLRNEIENAECSGIEFQPYEISFDEWLKPKGVRESLYGIV